MKVDRWTLCKKLGYEFKDAVLLESALCHRSTRGQNNERLEFLGDAILNFLIAEALYIQYPKLDEGVLSRFRANLVKKETLAQIATTFQLGDHIRLGTGELKSGGHRRESILADGLEAIIAAIYLDSDMLTCKSRVVAWYEERLTMLAFTPIEKDPKTQLQEYLQAKQENLPTYEVIEITGDQHQQVFHVRCTVPSLSKEAVGSGYSRRRAEQVAAAKIMEHLSHE